jgi:uncharacterized protein (UPF0332 family)
MAKVPPIDERNFLKLTQNHSEFRRKIQELGHETVALDVAEVAYRVGQCWLRLACEHMQDAKAAMASNLDRSAYSRSYYSVYNASKAIRYIVNGSVSLTGDDHKKASELPDDFPEVEKWAIDITSLREHRLRADYDNWGATESEHSLSATDVVELAEQFLSEAKQYLETKFGVEL